MLLLSDNSRHDGEQNIIVGLRDLARRDASHRLYLLRAVLSYQKETMDCVAWPGQMSWRSRKDVLWEESVDLASVLVCATKK